MKQKKSIYLGNNSLHEVTLPRYKEYDDKNPESIYTHSKKLINKSIRELYPSLIRKAQEGNGLNQKNTGLLGNMVELYHYGKVPDNIDRPDFPDAGKHGCELKCTGIKVGAPEAKELLRITKININNVTRFETFYAKLQLIVIIFYQYEKSTLKQDLKFLKSVLFELEKSVNKATMNEIKLDFYKILELMKAGKTKDIRSQTKVLEAGTQGGKGDVNKRAFYLKKNFVTAIYNKKNLKTITDDKEYSGSTINEIIVEKINPYIGKSLEELKIELGVTYSKGQNGYLVKKILGLDKKEESFEMKASNIKIKTIDLASSRKEQMSFPQINFVEMAKEKTFHDSEFFELVTPTFLFVIFDKDSNGNQILKNAITYKLNETDLLEVEKIWRHTVDKIKSGIYDEFILYETDRPIDKKRQRNPIGHIRPKDAKVKATGKYRPVLTPQGLNHSIKRQCLWLNRDFIDSIIN